MALTHYVIAYDIQDHTHRQHVLRRLRAVAVSYQDSVFEVHLTPQALHQLQQDVYPWLQEQDYFVTIRLGHGDAWQLGRGMLPCLGNLMVLI